MGGLRKNLIGQRHGMLEVIDNLNSNNQGVNWLCVCDCGNLTIAATGVLNAGSRVSCGCIHIGKNSARFKGYGDIDGSFWSQIKAGAKRRELKFAITKKYAWELFKKQNGLCALSRMPIFLSPSATYRFETQTASLDRIDNNKGYIVGNVQWLHKDVNIMKNIHNQEYFLSLCRRISGLN